MTYPPYLRVAKSEDDFPAPAGARRRYALRYPGDEGPPRWMWSPWTDKASLAEASEVLAWFVQRGLLARKVVPRRYSVAFSAPCAVCAAYEAGSRRMPCDKHDRSQVTHEHCLVDRDAEVRTPRTAPLRTWTAYNELRHQAWKQSAAKNYRKQGPKLAPDLRGVGVLTICSDLRKALDYVQLHAVDLKTILYYVSAIEDIQRGEEKRKFPVGRVGAARAIKRMLGRHADQPRLQRTVRRNLAKAIKLATDIERKFSRRTVE